MLYLLKNDLYRYTDRATFYSFVRTYIRNRGFRYVFWFRMAKCNLKLVSYFSRFVLFRMKGKYGIDIPWNTVIGSGLYIGHGQSVVISHTAKIGKNFNISQFCTIGTNHGKAAIIGDSVYIGPNCCLIENVIIGDFVTIGAGSVVTKNIPSNATAVGNPARVINYDKPGRYIKKCSELACRDQK